MNKLYLVVIFLCSGISVSIFSAGFRFKNDTPLKIHVFVARFRPYVSSPDGVGFELTPGGTFSHDAGAGGGYQSATITTCNSIVKFNFYIAGLTGIRDWVLSGNTTDNLSLYIGPVGFDAELGTIKASAVRKITDTCQ